MITIIETGSGGCLLRLPDRSALMDRPAAKDRDTYTYLHRGVNGPEGSLRILPLRHSPALQTGLDLLERQPMVLLGMSPGNGYFTRKRIEVAICGMARLLGDVTVVIPDTIAVHTYRALGYSDEDSRLKARRNGDNIRNRCLRAMEKARLQSPAARLQLLDWQTDLTALPGYDAAYAHVSGLFASHAAFRRHVLDKGRSVLSARLDEAAVTEAAVLECIEYLLKEFAFIQICRDALGRDLVLPYHQDFPLAHGFCDGTYQQPLPGIGWLVFEIELANEAQAATSLSF